MTFDEWFNKTYFGVGSAIGVDKESMRISYNAAYRAGQLAMRERAATKAHLYGYPAESNIGFWIAEKIRQLEPE